MADTFFGLDTSLSNLNDDEGGGGPSEDEYDALNDETFGQDSDAHDWEVEHEHLAEQLESSRRHHPSHRAQREPRDDHAAKLEASLTQLVLDEPDAVQSRTLGSSVWRHDLPFAPTPVPTLKNVCTVEELERQLRQKQPPFQQQNFYQPRFPPVILQRPPGLQAPVPLPFAPQQNMHNMTQMTQPLNKIIGQNSQMGQNNPMQNQMGQSMNQMGQNVNQMGQSMNPIGQNVNQMGQSMNQMGQNMNQFMQNVNQMNNFQNSQMGQSNMMNLSQSMQVHQMNQLSQNQMGQNMNQMGQSMNQMSQNMNQMGQNQIGQNVNQMGQNVNQMGQNMNQMGQNVNQMMPNGNQFSHSMNQFPHMMGQPRMMAPPPGLNVPRSGQNFNQNMGQYNTNFRGPSMPTKPEPQMNQQNMISNQQMMPQQLKHQSTQINQKSQQPINQLLSPQNKTPNKMQPNQASTPNQKMQKSRVYNNSKNLTSQNLVQMIQNTHPMLQYNNSFHNASHHPMLNNRNAFNNQFVNNHMFNNQRHNGSFSNNMHSMNGDDASISSDERDEYAGLMTQREKQWLVNIQMLQLSSGTPYIHDFYYTVFLERQANKEKEGVKEAHKANQQNHPFYNNASENSGNSAILERERHNSLRMNNASGEDAPRVYAPAQFENSLGKLQCGSVTAPRKIIDVEVVAAEQTASRGSRAPSRASTANPAEIPREMRRTKQLLLDIEALYLILLRLEELNDPLAISNAVILKEREEKQKQAEAALRQALERSGAESEHEDSNLFLRNIESVQRRPRPANALPDSPKEPADKRQVVNLAVSAKPPVKNLLDENKDDLIEKIFTGLLQTDRLPQVLTVRKGQALVSRFVSVVPARHALTRALWSRVLRALPAAARARTNDALAALAHHYPRYIQSTSGWSAILESCSLLSEALDPARTPHALTTSFTLSCVCALIEKAAALVNTPEATSNERQWSKFLKTLARALKNTTLNVARPVNPLQETKLMLHLKQLESRSTIEILQRGRTATEFADVSKTDVMEQLVKHLC